jgi:hypothetical protein
MRVDDNNSGTTPFIINDTGKVGIGTTNPQAPLHVNGAIKNKNPIFSYTYSGSLTSYTGEINAWNSLIYDTENGMVSNMRYTAKVAGYYFITATMRANSAGGGFRIRKNSNTYHGNSLTNPATEMHVSANAIVFLAVNDYVSLFAYGTIYSETNWSYFQGYMIG